MNKKGILLVLIMLMMAVTMAGCGDKTKEESATKKTEESGITDNTDEQNGTGSDTDDSQAGDFDFSQVFDNIEVGGKKVPFPFCLNDLGEGYEIRSVIKMEKGVCTGDLYFDEKIVSGIFINEDSVEKVNQESLITGLLIFDNYQQHIKINGINCESSIEDIENYIVDLDVVSNEEGNFSYEKF